MPFEEKMPRYDKGRKRDHPTTNHEDDVNERRRRRERALELRQHFSLPIAEIARRVGVSRTTLHKWLNGTNGMSPGQIAKVGRQPRVTESVLKQLRLKLQTQPITPAGRRAHRSQIAELVHLDFKIQYTFNSISRLLKSMNLSMKVVNEWQRDLAGK